MTPSARDSIVGEASWKSELLLCIVKDDSKGKASAGADGADAVAHGYSIDAASASPRSMVNGEDDGFTLMERHDGDAGLHARPLLGEDKLAAGEVAGGIAEEEGYLEREDERAVEVLMEAVVVAGLVLEEQRCGARLVGLMAEL